MAVIAAAEAGPVALREARHDHAPRGRVREALNRFGRDRVMATILALLLSARHLTSSVSRIELPILTASI